MIKNYEWLNPRIILASALYIITCVTLWIIEHRLYAGAIGTIFVYILVYPPLFLIGFVVFGKRQMKKDRKEIRAKIMGLTGAMVLVGCGLAVYNFVSGETYRHMTDWQILAIVIAVAAIGVYESMRGQDAKKILKVDYISMIFASLLLMTLAFLLITGPNTIAGAQKLLFSDGHTDTQFINRLPKEYEDLPEEIGPLGVYVFISGRQEVFIVDIATGEIFQS